MKKFLVGGAVRDTLLGVAIKDRDWVVVGATPEQMLDEGFEQVGASFPVFLHPETKEEHALARSEKSTGPGHHDFEVDFSPDVTLEEDLRRRDLTINAMAMDEENNLIDPFGGAMDLHLKILEPVSDAFKDDPLRVLRAARFGATLPGEWTVSERLWDMTLQMRATNQFRSLSKERVWKEVEKVFAVKGAFVHFFASELARAFWQGRECVSPDAWPLSRGTDMQQFGASPNALEFLMDIRAPNKVCGTARFGQVMKMWARGHIDAMGVLHDANVQRNPQFFKLQLASWEPGLVHVVDNMMRLKFADFDDSTLAPAEVAAKLTKARAAIWDTTKRKP